MIFFLNIYEYKNILIFKHGGVNVFKNCFGRGDWWYWRIFVL